MAHTINNCPVAIEDIHNANTVYGCNVPILKGKTVRQKLKRVKTEYIEVPENLKESIGKLTVAADFVFVNRIPFLVSVLRGVNFITV